MIERISKKYAMTEKGARDYVSAVFLVRTGQHQQNAARRRAGHDTLRHRRGADKRHRPKDGAYALSGRGRPLPSPRSL